MAAKKNATYPVVRDSELQIDGSADTKAVIRVDKVLSGRNHRLYRQSRMYTCKVDLDVNAAAGTVVDVYAIAPSWMAMKAYQLAFDTFNNNVKEERAQAGTMTARWNDFRVDHGLGTPYQKDLLYVGRDLASGGTHLYGSGSASEYLMSEVRDSASNGNTFRWTGTGAGTWNIIDEFDVTGNAPQSPATPSTDVAYSSLEDEIDVGTMEHLQDDGNRPPYDHTNIRNEIWVKVGTLSVNNTGQQKLSTGFFVAPAGLIAVDTSTPMNPAEAPILSLEVKGGDYKGVHAPSMLKDAKGAVFASSSKSAKARHNVRIR